jgi:sugar phosphate isomerase/epimerase
LEIGFAPHPRKKLVEEIEWIAKNGFQFVDLSMEPDNDEYSVNVSEIKKRLIDFGLKIIGHTAWYLPIGSPMKALRISAVDILSRQFEIFSSLGCQKVTVHANWPPGLFEADEGIAFQTESLQRLSDRASKLGIIILFESVITPLDNRKNIAKILKLNPDIEFHADIGHLNLHGRKPEVYISAFKDRLGHVHFHDNNGISDLHLPMGVGNVDWDNLIPLIKSVYDGTITLEIFCEDRDYVLLSKQKLEQKWLNCSEQALDE